MTVHLCGSETEIKELAPGGKKKITTPTPVMLSESAIRLYETSDKWDSNIIFEASQLFKSGFPHFFIRYF